MTKSNLSHWVVNKIKFFSLLVRLPENAKCTNWPLDTVTEYIQNRLNYHVEDETDASEKLKRMLCAAYNTGLSAFGLGTAGRQSTNREMFCMPLLRKGLPSLQ